MSTPEKTTFPDSITEAEGMTLTANWRNYITTLDPNPQYIKAFNIPMQDILNLSQFTKCPSVRAYLSMVTPNDVSTLKIILVPVDAAGNDILMVPGPTGVDQSSIFDFTTPCPQTCDLNSPLF